GAVAPGAWAAEGRGSHAGGSGPPRVQPGVARGAGHRTGGRGASAPPPWGRTKIHHVTGSCRPPLVFNIKYLGWIVWSGFCVSFRSPPSFRRRSPLGSRDERLLDLRASGR